jgi:hypothetical protein
MLLDYARLVLRPKMDLVLAQNPIANSASGNGFGTVRAARSCSAAQTSTIAAPQLRTKDKASQEFTNPHSSNRAIQCPPNPPSTRQTQRFVDAGSRPPPVRATKSPAQRNAAGAAAA